MRLVYLLIVIFSLYSQAWASGAGLTYQGRLVGPDGTAVTAANVQFRLQIRTPGNENCLLYEELQNKDMSNSNGVFALSINDGTGVRQDTNSYTIDQIFANRGTLTFPGSYCISGSNYAPNSSDGRKLQVYFNDGTFSGWEPVPAQAITYIPMAIESMQVGGYKKEQLIKVATGVDTTGFDLSAANFTEFWALLGGTSTQYVKPGAASFTAAPQWAGTPSAANDLANKSYVDAQIAAGLPNFGTAGTYTKVTTDAKGRVSSGTTLAASDIPALDAAKITTGILPIANGGTNSGTALTGSKVMVSDATAIVEGMASNTAKSNNTFVMRDGTGSFAAALGTFDGLSVLNGGSLALGGSLSGSVSLKSPAAPTSYMITLPSTAGTTGQVLTTDGSGITSWSSASSGLPAAAGTAAAPGYAFSGNTNTGMFGAAANQIGFSTNGTERLRVDASGNVGIGTTTPATALDVIGAIKSSSQIFLADGTAANPAYVFSSAQTTGLFTPASRMIAIATFGQERLRVTDTGNVGIGTATPGSKLTVNGDGTFSSASNAFTNVTVGNSSNGDQASSRFLAGNDVGANLMLGLHSSGNTFNTSLGASGDAYLYFTGGNKHLNIANTGTGSIKFFSGTIASGTPTMTVNVGNVGVGTTAPAALLDVNGTMRVNQICDSSGANCKTVSNGWSSAAGLSSLTAATGVDTIDNTNYAQTWNWSTATTQNPMSLSANALTTGSLLTLGSSSASFNSTSGLLNVANTSASTTGTVARIQSNSTAGSGLTVLANGNVGIGTSSPSYVLDVLGDYTAANSVRFFKHNSSHGVTPVLTLTSNYSGGSGASGDGSGLNFQAETDASTRDLGTLQMAWTDGADATRTSAFLFNTILNGGAATERLRISGNGNVGIGTTTPASSLTVKAAAGQNSPLSVLDSADNPFITTGLNSSATRFVGINSSSPGYASFGILDNGAPYSAMMNAATMYLQGDRIQRFVIKDTFWTDPTELEIGAGAGWAFVGTADNHALVFNTNNTERARITPTGNVGIGTATPSARMDVIGTFSAGGASGLVNTVTGVSAGAIGLNNSAAGQAAVALNISNSASGAGSLAANATNDASGMNSAAFGENNFAPSRSQFVVGPNALSLGSNATTLVSTDPVFAVGNGTSTIARSNAMTILKNGNVGIGTSAPATTLDVNGTMRLAKNAAQPYACDATHDGAIALTHLYTTCVCKGGSTAWVSAVDGTTACAW